MRAKRISKNSRGSWSRGF